MIPLFDLHCDTLEEMYLGNYSLSSSPLHISLDKCEELSPYIQVMAVWSDYRLTPAEAYNRYLNTIDYANRQGIKFIKEFKNLPKKCYILAIEDAKIIENDLERLNKLKEDGVKIITPFWKNTNQLGGAWNTNLPLNDFGIEFIKKCFELSIIPDISHASKESSKQIIEFAKSEKKTIIASHSNSYNVCNHKRNLYDSEFEQIVDLGGLVGISLASEHLCSGKQAEIKDVLNHIYKYLSLSGINNICLGCDFDGVSSLPKGISNISDLSILFEEIKLNFGIEAARKIFFENAYNFFSKNY